MLNDVKSVALTGDKMLSSLTNEDDAPEYAYMIVPLPSVHAARYDSDQIVK